MNQLKEKLNKITQEMIELSAKRQEVYKDFLAEKYHIVFGETQHYLNNSLYVIDDVMTTPYVGSEDYLLKNHNPTFIARKVFKNGNVANNPVHISSRLKSSRNASKEKITALSGKLSKIQNKLIDLNEKRRSALEMLYQKQKKIVFGKSIFSENGKEFLIIGLNASPYIEKIDNQNLVRCQQILKTGKQAKTTLNKTFCFDTQIEVRRLA